MLADACEPLVLADGSKIDPTTGEVLRDRPSRFVAIPSNTQAKKEVARARRQLAELPAPPRQMNLLAVVFSYTTFGLSDSDIAIATKMTQEQIVRIKASDEYGAVARELARAIVETETDDVRTLISRNATAAANRMLELADSENEAVAVKAAGDILDRAGLRPADVVQHNVKLDGGLTIEVVERKGETPTLDLEVEE